MVTLLTSNNSVGNVFSKLSFTHPANVANVIKLFSTFGGDLDLISKNNK